MVEKFGEEYFEKGTMSGYRGYNFDKEFWRFLVEDLIEMYHPRRVLDVGCANGCLVECFIDCEVETYGIDISSYIISKASNKVRPFIRQLDINSEPFPFSNGYFDLITCLDVLEHISILDYALLEIRRCLSKNGRIFIKIPNPKHPDAKGDVTHINIFPKSVWEDLFAKYGFKVKRIHPKSRGKTLKKFPLSNLTRKIAYTLRKRLDNYWFELTILPSK